MKQIIGVLTLFLFAIQAQGQCDSWVGKANKEEIMEWHTIYRGALKSKDYKFAEEHWLKVFEAAPTADGKRDTHYKDGIKIYKKKYKTEKDAAKKKEYADKIIALYDQAIACYQAKAIKPKCSSDACIAARVGKTKGDKGYDIYYTLADKKGAFEHLLASLKEASKSLHYKIITPLSFGTVERYKEGEIDGKEARAINEMMAESVDAKIAKGGKFKDKWVSAKENIQKAFAGIEHEIFDCAYYVKKLKPAYTADPDNPEVLKITYAYLKQVECDEDEPFYKEVSDKWAKYAAERNAQLQAEFDAKNPSKAAKNLYDKGKFQEAIDKYREAISQSDDDYKKATYLFSVASIQFRKLQQYSQARKTALEAASLRKDWGRPYLLIGDMYAKSSRSCGDDWNQRLAVLAALAKYNYAKSVDSEVADEANRKIGIYYKSKPMQDEGFMRGFKKGQKVKVGCWIGETVTISYQ